MGEIAQFWLKIVTGGAITAGLFSLTIWFLVRYVKTRDDFEAEVKKKIEEIPAKIEKSVAKIEQNQSEMKKQVENLKNSSLNFQQSISKELIGIERHAVRTEAIMEKTAEKAKVLEERISGMSDKVVFHDKVLKDLVNVAKDLNSKVADNKEQIKTVITHIGEDKIMVGQKTKKS